MGIRKVLTLLATLLLVGCAMPTPRPEPTMFVSPVGRAAAPVVERNYIMPHYLAGKGVGVGWGSGYEVPPLVGAGWWHNWEAYGGGSAVPGFVPTVKFISWIGQPMQASEWLLTFNECDKASQANCTPSQAAAAWPSLLAVYPGRKVIGPTISHDGYYWLVQFLAMIPAGQMPYALSTNCYLPVQACKTHVSRTYQLGLRYGITHGIWVKEFCMGEANARDFIAWMGAHPATVERYAWFLATDGAREWESCRLWDEQRLTPLGQMYRDQ